MWPDELARYKQLNQEGKNAEATALAGYINRLEERESPHRFLGGDSISNGGPPPPEISDAGGYGSPAPSSGVYDPDAHPDNVGMVDALNEDLTRQNEGFIPPVGPLPGGAVEAREPVREEVVREADPEPGRREEPAEPQREPPREPGPRTAANSKPPPGGGGPGGSVPPPGGGGKCPVKSGDIFERTVETTKGPVEVLAEIAIDGETLILKDIAVYGQGSEPLTGLTREMLGALRELAREAKALGYKKLIIRGTRVEGSTTGKKGDKSVNIEIDLEGY